jgi:pyruvate,water dikinase
VSANYRYVRFFQDIRIDDVPSVGGKNASLGEMYRELTTLGVKVPNGFAVTAQAYWYVLEQAGILTTLRSALDGLRPDDVDDLAKRGRRARELVYSAPLPADLQSEILEAYRVLQREYGPTLSLAVRSSATAEDLPDVSFAGMHESYLNIEGEEHLLEACRRCLASLFTDRAIHYRIDEGFDHFKVALSICVMKMVRSDVAASGVMFSLDTESGFPDVVFVTGAYGLGENVVQGTVDPDEFYVFKPTFEAGHRAVLRRALGSKKIKMIYSTGGARATTRNVPTPNSERERFCISDEEVLTLADYAIKVEKHYSAKAGKPRPMDMEWAKDGTDGELYMVQARPETVVSQRHGNVLETYNLQAPGELLAAGRSIGEKIASGRFASSPISLAWPSSGRARYWWPIPPRPTGSRS